MGDEDRGQRTTLILVVGTLALFLLHLWVSSRIAGPSVVYDEAGYLGNARWLAGNQNWQMPFSPAYSSGYPLLLTPIMAVTNDPDLQFRLALVVNAALLATTFPLLVAVLRKVFGVARWPATTAGLLGAIIPAVLAAGISAIAENLVLPLVLATTLGAWRMASASSPTIHRIWFGLGAAGLYAAHPRFTVPLLVAASVIAIAAVRRMATPAILAINAAGLVGGTLAARALSTTVVNERWRDVQRPEGELADWADLLTTRSGLAELVRSIAGQGWYLLVGSLGLAAIGFVVAAATVAQRGPRLDLPVGDAQVDRRAAPRLAAGYLVASASAVFATSVVFFTRNQFRIDHYVYGRHNDSFSPLWVALGVAFVLSLHPASKRARALLWTIVPIVATGVTVNLTRDPLDFDSRFSPFASPAIVRLVELDKPRAFLWATLLAVGAVLAMAAIVVSAARPSNRRWTGPRAGGVAFALAGAWFLYNGFGTATGTQRFEDLNLLEWAAPDDIDRLGIDSLAIDASADRSRPVLNYPFFLPDVLITTYDGARADDPPVGPYVLTSADDPDIADEGARLVVLDQGYLLTEYGEAAGLGVWVRPGAELDRLDRLGALLPEGFPTALPDSAHDARVEIIEPPAGPIGVEPGGRIPLEVRVAHEGTGAPWPDRQSYGLPGHVRVVALITPEGPDGVAGARSGGELPGWMLPGDERTVMVEVAAVDQFLSPLPPGTYRVELAIAQTGQDWTTTGGPGATFTMEVAG